MLSDPDAKLQYCRAVLLPMWERWTDGHPALRRALDRAGADPRSGRACQQMLQRIMARLQAHGRTPSVQAAIAAGWAGLYCLRDAPPDTLASACRRAQAAHQTAQACQPPIG